MNRYPWEWVHCSLDNSRFCVATTGQSYRQKTCRVVVRYFVAGVFEISQCWLLTGCIDLCACSDVFPWKVFFKYFVLCQMLLYNLLVAVPFCTVWHSRPSCSVAPVWICMVQLSYAAVYSIQLTITISTCPRSKQATDVPCAPHGLRGCKNRHAPFPGWMFVQGD